MSDFYIVPPRLIVGSLQRSNVVTSLNTLRGDLSFKVSPDTGLILNINSGVFNLSIQPDFYIKKSGDIVPSNIIFQPDPGKYGLAVGSGAVDPGIGVSGALYFNTTYSVLKVYDGSTWNEIASTGTSGITQSFADTRYTRLDGGNTPTGAISMGSQFLRFANLTTRSTAGTAGQVYYNTDTNRLDLYNGSSWIAVGSGITQITAGNGISLSNAPITSYGSVSVNENYNFNWTGSHTYSQPITFSASQMFDASKLTIAYEVAGDLLKFDGVSWVRMPKGSPHQILSVACCSDDLEYVSLVGGSGIAISFAGGQAIFSSTGITGSINIVAGKTGFDFNVSGSGNTYTINIPNAGVGFTGLVTGLGQTFGGIKTFSNGLISSAGATVYGSLYLPDNPLASIYGGTGYTNYNLGDLLVGAGSTFIKLPSGSDGLVLSSNTSYPSGLGWTTVTGVAISTAPPGGPKHADLWWNSYDGSLSIYYDDLDTNQWVEVVSNNNIDWSQSINITSATASTNTSTGALVVLGGVGIGGSLYVGSPSSISGVTINNGVITGNLVGTATTAGFASTSLYSYQSGYATTSGSSGLAITAANVNVVSGSANASHPILFTPAIGSGSGVALSSNPTLAYNPSSNIFSVSGLAVTAGTASTNKSTGALVVSGGVGIEGDLHARTLVVNSTYDVVGTAVTVAGTASTDIYSLSSSTYRSVKYMVQITHGTDYQVQEILLMHDDTDTYLTQYAQLLSANDLILATYDADLYSGNMRLLVTPTYTNTTFKIYGTAVRL
jgi:hypothetical protein